MIGQQHLVDPLQVWLGLVDGVAQPFHSAKKLEAPLLLLARLAQAA